MPPQRRPRRVLCDQSMDKVARRHAQPSRHAIPQPKQTLIKRDTRQQSVRIEVIRPTKTHNSSLGHVLLVPGRMQR